ncbi:TPA: HD domain-containing protein [Pseudomonas aeruginosa]|nr:bifunctional (p)ppGpp synthetase/guanosine-3',5'-bis(diphosphate) 3'-pyrophosphohydrolase [Pseudomonas aeruginosa]EIU2864236.1 bifunctional (p)ppGpp synthetase/guanosine-3',5'-bis(diphosphate) 3'-pyrophosphohydrolase [Pseudomonas aeruginosa]
MITTDLLKNNLVARARSFAIGAHAAIDQRMPFTGEPYEVHLESVVALLSQFTSDPEALAEAWLHDVLEDTGVTFELLRREFGDNVATTVRMVSKVSRKADGNRATRAEIDRHHYANGSARAQDIKLVDAAVNVRTIVERAAQFAAVYVPEKAALVESLTKGDIRIRRHALQVISDAQSALRKIGLN